MSKIPQRIKDDKSSKSEHSQVSDISDSFFDKLDSRKDKLSNTDHSKHDRNGYVLLNYVLQGAIKTLLNPPPPHIHTHSDVIPLELCC